MDGRNTAGFVLSLCDRQSFDCGVQLFRSQLLLG